ncbi:MAG: DKNYY domain-containing protein [Patescibacteria group bacterium]
MNFKMRKIVQWIAINSMVVLIVFGLGVYYFVFFDPCFSLDVAEKTPAYAKENGRVCYVKKGGHGIRTLWGADVKTFESENENVQGYGYGADKNHFYYYGNILPIKRDNAKFVGFYLTDGNVVIYEGRVTGIDGNTFSVFEGENLYSMFARDKKFVYLGDYLIKGANPDKFVPVGFRVGKDDRNVYWYDTKSGEWEGKYVYYEEGYILPDADPETFRVYDSYLSKDKDHVYLKGKLIEEADPNTFSNISENYYYSKDKINLFCNGKKIEKNIKDIDLETIKEISVNYVRTVCSDPEAGDTCTVHNASHYYFQDKNHCYDPEDCNLEIVSDEKCKKGEEVTEYLKNIPLRSML